MIIDVFYYKSDMHTRPMQFRLSCTPADSSDKTQLICSTILMCLFVSKYDISANRLNDTVVSRNKFKYHTLICKSTVRIKQTVISVAFKHL